MHKGVLGLIILIIFFFLVIAEVSLPPWSWNTYNGTSSWIVTITEDESHCNGGPITIGETSVGIRHSSETAVMTSVGHGSSKGTFTSGNVLHFPARTVSDPPGTSRLSDYDLTFTPDCSLFTGKYDWSYNGPGGSCQGSTGLAGRNEKQGCPAPSLVAVVPSVEMTVSWADAHQAEIARAHSDLTKDLDLRDSKTMHENLISVFDRPDELTYDSREIERLKALVADETNQIKVLEPKTEAEYLTILDADPDNYFANWDMAALRKSQGNWNEYSYYIQKVLGNKNLEEKTRDFLKNDIAQKNGFSIAELPAPERSPLLRRMVTEGNSIQSIYGQDFRKDTVDASRWNLVRWTIFAPIKDVTTIVPAVIYN